MIQHPHFPAETATVLHFIFEWLSVFIGAWLYRRQFRQQFRGQCQSQSNGYRSPKASLGVLIGCLVGAGIGNKLLFVIEVPQTFTEHSWTAFLLGQTIVGGLLGGLIGIEMAKKILHIKHSTGDKFILPLTVAIVIGRTGCFLAGLYDGTYGIATDMPWGVNFGDNIARHPTQIYEQLFVIGLYLVLWHFKGKLSVVSGLSFKLFLASYLCWRLSVDAIKPIPYDYWGLSGIQWACVIALLLYVPITYRAFKQLGEKQC